MATTLENLVFVAFNSRVAALDRDSGDIRWSWKAPDGSGFVALLLDGDCLFASVHGYTYRLDPLSGRQIWQNRMKGFGFGVPCLASVHGHSPHPPLEQAHEDQQSANSTSGLNMPP